MIYVWKPSTIFVKTFMLDAAAALCIDIKIHMEFWKLFKYGFTLGNSVNYYSFHLIDLQQAFIFSGVSVGNFEQINARWFFVSCDCCSKGCLEIKISTFKLVDKDGLKFSIQVKTTILFFNVNPYSFFEVKTFYSLFLVI